MLHWRVILLAALALLLLIGGLVALILPDSYEGQVLYMLDEQHTVRALDVLGVALLIAGCGVAWAAGLAWHRRVHAP